VTLLRNWSERPELHDSRLHDCGYSAALTCLVAAGFANFPHGIFTAEEREALERADDRANEGPQNAGDVDQATTRRYGKTLHELDVALKDALQRRGTIVSLAGSYAGFPKGHRLRRWDPAFIGGHRIAVAVRSDGSLLWLDPEAPMNYAGDVVTAAEVLVFADGVSQDQQRFVRFDEFAPPPPPVTVRFGATALAKPRRYRLTAGRWLRSSPALVPSNHVTSVSAGATFDAYQYVINRDGKWIGSRDGSRWLQFAGLAFVRYLE
jgi:hypothetical protein